MSTTHQERDYLRLRRAVLLGLFTGTGVGLGFLLAGVPGVELMSLNAALGGAALGLGPGVAAGALSVLIYSLASPFGPPVPPLLAVQALGMGLAGALGALVAPALRRLTPVMAASLAAIAGLLAALVFDLATNAAAAAAFGLPVVATLVAGLPVGVLHAGTNAAAFAVLLPPLGRRVQGLLRRGPRVGVLPLLVLLLGASGAGARPLPAADAPANPAAAPDSLGAVPADTLASVLADSTAVLPGRAPSTRRLVKEWRRPLWRPFAGTLREQLDRESAWLPVIDGGLGAPVHYVGEPGTAAAPLWTRDGLPLGVGHRYLDDPEAIIRAGHRASGDIFGLAADGSLAGTVDLQPIDASPDRDVLDTRWQKGAHETYLRDVRFLTAAAPWRLGFAFGEVLDNEGYDFRVAGETRYAELDEPDALQRAVLWGEGKVRSGRGLVQRDLGEAGTLTLGLENVRKLKRALPAYGLDHQDLWQNRASLDWRRGAERRPARLALWWVDTDADWNRGRASYRKQEASASGVLGAWGDPAAGGRIAGSWRQWTLRDSGADPAWAAADSAAVDLRGQAASLLASRGWRLGGAGLGFEAGGWWDEHGGLLLGGRATLAEPRSLPRWSLALERGGRAPRSDELATAWSFLVPGRRRAVALPNRNLGREDEWRLAATAGSRLAGFDLALEGALRRLRDGIGWRPLETGAATGRWEQGLELDSTTLRASLAREGRCFGWLRLRADATWRTWQQRGPVRAVLPPALDWRLTALWEQHFFQEDGILQLAWYLHNRGAMDDPWYLAETVGLPAAATLDMIVGFRLLGTDLGVEILNLAGGGSRLSAGAVGPATELRWRLHWVFHY